MDHIKDSSDSYNREEDYSDDNPSPLENGEDETTNIFETTAKSDICEAVHATNENDPQDGWHTVKVGRETMTYEATATGKTRSGKSYKAVEEVSANATVANSNTFMHHCMRAKTILTKWMIQRRSMMLGIITH
jgi:hypothetical protein